jgi:hypothetical protein
VGYRLKDSVADVPALHDTLRRIQAGEAVIEPELVRRLVAPEPAEPEATLAELTATERKVLELMAEGLSNGGIAARLSVSTRRWRGTSAGCSQSSGCRRRPRVTVECSPSCSTCGADGRRTSRRRGPGEHRPSGPDSGRRVPGCRDAVPDTGTTHMAFRNAAARLSAGGATVDTVLDTPQVSPGGTVAGTVHMAGGKVAQDGSVRVRVRHDL